MYDGWNVVQERNASGQVLKSYAWGLVLGPLLGAIAGSRKKGGRSPLGGALGEGLHKIADAFDLPPRQRANLLPLTLAIWLRVLLWFSSTLRAVGETLTVLEELSAGLLGVAGSILPVSLFGSFALIRQTIGSSGADAS